MKKFYSLFLGIFLTILVFEIWLRSFAYIHTAKIPDSDKLNRERDTFTILTLGNSFTQGMGAPLGQSYPDQLRDMIKAKYKNAKINMFNDGTGGQNTAQLLRKLHSNLDQYSPDLVIVQSGQPNWWNTYHYSDYLEREKKLDIFDSSNILNLAYDLAYNLKAFRFVVYSLHKVIVENRVTISEFDNKNGGRPYFANSEGMKCLHEQRSMNECINIFEKAINVDSSNPENYYQLGSIYFDSLDDQWKGMKLFIDGISNTYMNPHIAGNNFLALQKRLPLMKSPLTKLKVNVALSLLRLQSPDKAASINMDKNYYEAWVLSDFKEITNRLKERKVKFIFQNYPPLPAHFMVDDINRISRDFSKNNGIAFVDNEKIYQTLWDSGLDRMQYHAQNGTDPHPNAKGYKIVAQNVLGVLESENLLPFHGPLKISEN